MSHGFRGGGGCGEGVRCEMRKIDHIDRWLGAAAHHVVFAEVKAGGGVDFVLDLAPPLGPLLLFCLLAAKRVGHLLRGILMGHRRPLSLIRRLLVRDVLGLQSV